MMPSLAISPDFLTLTNSFISLESHDKLKNTRETSTSGQCRMYSLSQGQDKGQ